MANAQPRPDESSEYSVFARWVILVAIMLGTILEVLDTSIVNVAVPTMMGNLGATVDQIAWVSTGYIVANVIVLPLTGWLSNQFGRKRYLTFSIILFTVASLLCGLSRSLNELILFRIIQGAGGAALLSTAQATLFEVFPKKQVPMIQAIFSIGVVAAPTFGPTLGGFIVDAYSWPWVFFINIPIGIVAAILGYSFLKDSKFQRAKTSIDLYGIGFLAVGLGCLQTVLEKGDREMWFESNLIVTLTIISAVSLIAFLYWELRCPYPAVNLRVLKHRGLSAGVLYAGVLGFGLYGGIFILPLYLQNIRQFDAAQSGLVLMPGGLMTIFCLPFMSKLVQKVQPRYLLAIGTPMFALSMYAFRTITNQTSEAQIYMPLILRGFAISMMFLPLTISSLGSLKPSEVPAGAGLFNLMRQLGGSAGIAFLSTQLDQQSSAHRAALVDHITAYSPATQQRITDLNNLFMSKGASLQVAQQRTFALIDKVVTRESTIQAFGDCFVIIAIAFAMALPLLLLFEKPVAQKNAAPIDAH